MPNIIPDRDSYRNWYLNEDVYHTLHNGHILIIRKGYRFNGHSTKPFHWIFSQNDVDIFAALIHDALIDTMPWHRYPRLFIDTEYSRLMEKYSYGHRKAIMPLVVFAWGYLTTFGWTDQRGDYSKQHSVIDVGIRQVL